MSAARALSIGLTAAVFVVAEGSSRPAAAQDECAFVDPGNDVLVQRPPFTYVTNPHFRCEGDIEIWADSAVVNSDQQMFLLLGTARYLEQSRELNAREVRYFYGVGRVQARGDVRVTDSEDGSGVENGDLVYLRQTEFRALEETTVTTGEDGIRPRATVYPRPAPPTEGEPADTTATEADEYVVVGDSIFLRGDAYLYSSGSVEIVRDSLFGFADSAEYDGDVGGLVLDGSARVEGASYDLVGRTITLEPAPDGGDRIHAVREAVLTGDDLDVRAPRIVLHLGDGELQRMVAVTLEDGDTASAPDPAPPRPIAVSEDLELVGDSLDLDAPGGVLRRILAAGSAQSVSGARASLNVESLPELAREDWMDADTIEVMLIQAKPDSAAAAAAGAGTSEEYEVERIVARVGARSLYRLEPADSAAVPGVDPPAVSYMVADQITIFMVDGRADRVESVGEVSGWHLEPVNQSAEEPGEPAPGGSASDPPPVPEPFPDAASDDAGGDGQAPDP